MTTSNLHPLAVLGPARHPSGSLAGYCFTTYSALRALLFEDFSIELQDPWPVVERLRMALREAERYCLGAENTTGHCITALLEILPDEDD